MATATAKTPPLKQAHSPVAHTKLANKQPSKQPHCTSRLFEFKIVVQESTYHLSVVHQPSGPTAQFVLFPQFPPTAELMSTGEAAPL